MGNENIEAPTKTPKSSLVQEQNQTPKSSPVQEPHVPSNPATVFPDWASYQAYCNSVGAPIPPPGYFHSSVASSPQAHSYVWGQHMIPPYGTAPSPYVTMYPPGGIYPHPSMPPGSHPYGPYTMLSPNGTVDASASAGGGKGKTAESKGKLPIKRSKGSLGSLSMLTGKGSETEKASGASDNGGGLSQSGDSEEEESSEGSDANSHNGSDRSGKDSVGAEVQNGGSISSGSRVAGVPAASVTSPTTNLNIGMDYWGQSASPEVAAARAKLTLVPVTTAIVSSSVVGSHEAVTPELCLQDERELKRQRRKQSNRESARRSRLRKQAEYDELAKRVEALKQENVTLREELGHMNEECEKLASENASLTDKFRKHTGEDPRVRELDIPPQSNPQNSS